MKVKAFAVIPRKDEIEIKPLVLCKECRYWHDDGIMTTCDRNIGHGYSADWFCAGGEKKKTRRYYTQDVTITWEEEDDG